MKKLFVLLLTAIMSAALLTGCSDPVFDDFENFLNVEMAEINENYKEITAEAGKWENMEEDSRLVSSLKDVLIPLTEDSLEKLEDVKPETDEVKKLKKMYVELMKSYNEGFEEILEGIENVDEETMFAGNEKVAHALELVDEYNEAPDDLAEELGTEITY